MRNNKPPPFLVLSFLLPLLLLLGISISSRTAQAAENELAITATSCMTTTVAWNDIVDTAGNKLLTVTANGTVVFSQELTDAVGVDDDASFSVTAPANAVLVARLSTIGASPVVLDEDTLTLPACPTPATATPTATSTATPITTVVPQTARLTISKDTNPSSVGVFSRFSIARDASRVFDLEDDESITFDLPAPGRFILTEDSPASGWQLAESGIRCRFVSDFGLPSYVSINNFYDPRLDVRAFGSAAAYDFGLRRAFLFLLPGDSVACEFTNERIPLATATPQPTSTPVPAPTSTPQPPAPPQIITVPAAPPTFLIQCSNGSVIDAMKDQQCPVPMLPTLAPTSTAPIVTGPVIRPPSTGDAGLASQRLSARAPATCWDYVVDNWDFHIDFIYNEHGEIIGETGSSVYAGSSTVTVCTIDPPNTGDGGLMEMRKQVTGPAFGGIYRPIIHEIVNPFPKLAPSASGCWDFEDGCGQTCYAIYSEVVIQAAWVEDVWYVMYEPDGTSYPWLDSIYHPAVTDWVITGEVCV